MDTRIDYSASLLHLLDDRLSTVKTTLDFMTENQFKGGGESDLETRFTFLSMACQLDQFLYVNRDRILTVPGNWWFFTGAGYHRCFPYALIYWISNLLNTLGMKLSKDLHLNSTEPVSVVNAIPVGECKVALSHMLRAIGLANYAIQMATRSKWFNEDMSEALANIKKQSDGFRYVCCWLRIAIQYHEPHRTQDKMQVALNLTITCIDLIEKGRGEEGEKKKQKKKTKKKDIEPADLILRDCSMMLLVLRGEWYRLRGNDNVKSYALIKRAQLHYQWKPSEDQELVRYIAEEEMSESGVEPTDAEVHEYEPIAQVSETFCRNGLNPLEVPRRYLLQFK